MNDHGLLVDCAPALARLTLARPERRNALTPELCQELIAVLERLAADEELRCVLLAGEGSSFCAGFDLTRLGEGEPGAEARLVERLCSTIRAMPVPVVARVQGAASGAGCDLALSCDLRIAAEGARLAAPPARLGFIYEPGGIARLVEAVGAPTARAMLLLGEPIDASRAYALGAVHEIAALDDLDAAVEAVLARVLANAPLSIRAGRLAVNAFAAGAPPPDGLLAELTVAGARVWSSEDSREGPRAFQERRPPRFRGR